MSTAKHFKSGRQTPVELAASASTATFLNADGARYRVVIHGRRELGLIARVSLIFSRRGLDIAMFNLTSVASHHDVKITLEFLGNQDQLRAVCCDLSKLIDVESVHAASCQETTPVASPLNLKVNPLAALEHV